MLHLNADATVHIYYYTDLVIFVVPTQTKVRFVTRMMARSSNALVCFVPRLNNRAKCTCLTFPKP